MRLQIIEPCTADWDKMKIGLFSRHCESCNKNVIDFRGQSKAEILLYLFENKGQKTCGRFYSSQLDYIHLEEVITISALRQLPKSKRFAVLTVACMLLASCATDSDESTNKNSAQNETIISVVDSIQTSSALPDTSLQATNSLPKNPIPAPIDTAWVEISGEVVEDPWPIDTDYEEEETLIGSFETDTEPAILVFAEKMPEFPGGMDSLFSFLRKNIQYPADAKRNEVSGRVYAQIVIEKDGSISNPKILRGIDGYTSFDAEVLRVISMMPKWIPATQRGNPVRVSYNLPFAFKTD